jgi:hypothetical protein
VPAISTHCIKDGAGRCYVRGLTIPALATIIARFPTLKRIASGGVSNNEEFIAQLIVGCAEAIGPIIAAASGHLGEAEYEKRASALSPEQQLKFLEPIVWLTFPNGIGSFAATVMRLVGGAKEVKQVVKVRLRQSRSTSPLSSDAGSRPTMQ